MNIINLLVTDAEIFGYSITATCCLSILFVVVVIVIIIFILKWIFGSKQTVIVQQGDSSRRCPNCGRPIQMDANVCPYCGKKF